MTTTSKKPKTEVTISSKQGRNPIEEIAKQEGIPPTGITIMGGRPYINVTGLDVKLKNLCQERKLELARIEAKNIVEPSTENGFLVGYHAEVVLFDRENFVKTLGKLGQIDKETLQELRESFTYRYTGEGWASPLTCEGIGYRYHWTTQAGRHQKVKGSMLLENVIMMAERRATNRAKREATGTGLTSTDELPTEPTAPPETIEESPPPPPPKDDFTDKVKQYVNTRGFKEWAKKNAFTNMKDVKASLKIFFNKPLRELDILDIEKWRENETKTTEETLNEGVGYGLEEGENLSGAGAVAEGTKPPEGGELIKDSD